MWHHIYPVKDLVEHNTESMECICGPEIDWKNELVIHAAMDRRECFEKTKMRPLDTKEGEQLRTTDHCKP